MFQLVRFRLAQPQELTKTRPQELAKKRAFLPRGRRKQRRASHWMINLMYVPALILMSIFIFYPFMQGIHYSFTNWDGFSAHFSWVGLTQYGRILNDPEVQRAIGNTFIYGLGSTLLQNILGLAYALFLDQKIRGKGLVRTIVYLPIIISPLIMGYICYFFFQYDGGAANDVLHLLGRAPLDWLSNGTAAVWIITFVNTYQYMGIAMVIYLAGLQAIPKEYLEAAAIDGAGRLARIRMITLPLLMPSITISVVYNVIGGLKLFDVIMAMTQGNLGSNSISTMMYTLYFRREDAGYAAALGNVMFLMITVVGLVLLRYLRRKEVQL